uniref:Uncharacterized protein n=1 Tax=Lygus hesperus TaxID=30085 RepID=A0A0A9Y213_LYGHE
MLVTATLVLTTTILFVCCTSYCATGESARLRTSFPNLRLFALLSALRCSYLATLWIVGSSTSTRTVLLSLPPPVLLLLLLPCTLVLSYRSTCWLCTHSPLAYLRPRTTFSTTYPTVFFALFRSIFCSSCHRSSSRCRFCSMVVVSGRFVGPACAVTPTAPSVPSVSATSHSGSSSLPQHSLFSDSLLAQFHSSGPSIRTPLLRIRCILAPYLVGSTSHPLHVCILCCMLLYSVPCSSPTMLRMFRHCIARFLNRNSARFRNLRPFHLPRMFRRCIGSCTYPSVSLHSTPSNTPNTLPPAVRQSILLATLVLYLGCCTVLAICYSSCCNLSHFSRIVHLGRSLATFSGTNSYCIPRCFLRMCYCCCTTTASSHRCTCTSIAHNLFLRCCMYRPHMLSVLHYCISVLACTPHSLLALLMCTPVLRNCRWRIALASPTDSSVV